MIFRDRARNAFLILITHPNHYMMWGASTAMSIIFFVELAAGSALYQWIFAVVGYSFDYTKDILWRRSITENRKSMKNTYRGIAVGFAAFSIMATGLAGLTVAEKFAPSSKRVDPATEIASLQSDIEANRKDVTELKAQRDALPADYATAKLKYQAAISALEDRGRDLVLRMAEKKAGSDAPVVNSSKRMFDLIADKLGTGISSVVFWFFMFFGLWLEIGNFSTAPELDEPKEEKPIRAEPPVETQNRPAKRSRPSSMGKESSNLTESILEAPLLPKREIKDIHPDLFGESQ